MKRSRQETQQTHQRIVQNAAQQIRVQGVNGVGIADLMGQAGLTHGGFYAHFRNKDALLAEICLAGLAETLGKFTQAVDHAPDGVLIAGDRRGREDDRVAVLDPHLPVLVGGHAR